MFNYYKKEKEITTEKNNKIKTTTNHPLLTKEGWKKAIELKQEKRKFNVRNYKEVFSKSKPLTDEKKSLKFTDLDNSWMHLGKKDR